MNTETVPHTVSLTLPAGQAITVPLVDVQSSQISRLGHHAETKTLLVQFQPNARKGEVEGSVYRYENVDEALYTTFRNADSIGRFFKTNIKPDDKQFPYAKVADGVTAEQLEQKAAA